MVHQVGQQVGNYRLVCLLGKGGTAEVYLGEHIHLGTQAAIKVLHTRLASDDVERFRREAQIVARLTHPHIVRVLDFGVEDTTPFLVMEHASYGTMRTRYLKGSRLPLEMIITYVKQVADALYYLHEQKKLVHRDVKPENMLLRADQDLLLSDFGIVVTAHTTGELLLEGQAGTFPYMAPEQILKMSRPASDQYALGIVVYEWLCGNRPFDGLEGSILYHHLSTPPPALHEHSPSISPAVENVVFKALAKDPKKRFVDVLAFATALEHACSAFSTSGQPVQPNVTVETISPNQTSSSTSAAAPPHQSLTLRQPVPHFSRRRAMWGLIGVMGLGFIGGGLAWLTHAPTPQSGAPSFRPVGAKSTASPLALSLYCADGTMLYKVDVKTGTVHWRYENGPDFNRDQIGGSPPLVTNGGVYFVTQNSLVGLNASNGTFRWRFRTTSQEVGVPMVVNDLLYMPVSESVYALNASDGSVQKRYSVGGTKDPPGIVLSNGVMYVVTLDNTKLTSNQSGTSHLMALDIKSGLQLWNHVASLESRVISDFIVVNDRIYLSTTQLVNGTLSDAFNSIYAFNAKDGSLIWHSSNIDLPLSGLTADNKAIYVGTQPSYLYALDRSTGNILWRYNAGGTVMSVLANTSVYIGVTTPDSTGSFSGNGYIAALNAKGPSERWRYNLMFYEGSAPLVESSGTIYVGSSPNWIYALHVTNGSKFQQFQVGNSVFLAPPQITAAP